MIIFMPPMTQQLCWPRRLLVVFSSLCALLWAGNRLCLLYCMVASACWPDCHCLALAAVRQHANE